MDGPNKKIKTLEETVLLLQQQAKDKPISIEEIVKILSGKGRHLLVIFLSLPFCLPIQIPGLSIPFGLAIAFLGLRSAFGKRIWLPKKILSKRINAPTLFAITTKTLSLIRKIRRWIHPRLLGLFYYPGVGRVNGVIIFILGAVLALPLPIPLSNLTAAWSILLISIGLLEKDGIFLLCGYLGFVFTTLYFVVITISIKTLIK